MDVSLQHLADYLAAPAGSMTPDGSAMCLIEEENGELIEKVWTGNEVSKQVLITSDVKKSTPAVYLVNQNVRRVAFLDALDNLQCYQYDEVEEEWMRIDSLPSIPVYPETRLSGCFHSDDQTIFFQGKSGQLQGVRISMTDRVGPCFPLPATGMVPLIHSAFTSDDMALHLLFTQEDGSIQDLKFDPASKGWQVAGKLEFGAYRIARILVISTDDTVPLQILALTSSDMLIYSNKQGQQVEVGTIKDGIFVAHTSKECAGEIVTLGSKALGKGATLIKRLSGAKK